MQEIASAIASGRCVLFAGSGTSRDAGLPDWLGLVERLRDDLRDQGKLQPAYYDAITAVLADHKDLGVSLQILQSAVRRQELVLALRRILNPTSPSQITKALADIGFAGTVTTNYDRVINETVSGNAYTLSNGSHDLKIVPTAVSASDQFLFKVHGDIDDQLSPTDSLVTRGGPFMVITEADFSILQGSRGDQLLLSLHSILQERSVLFLGYSFGDPDIGHILRYLGDNCQFIHPSWFVSRKGSSVPNLPSNVTPVLELDDWSQLPDWLAELKEAVEQEQRNPTETVVGVVTSRKLISDEEHQTLLALARYLNGLESDDLAERVLAAALLEEISAKERFDTSWLQVKVGELLDIGPAWAEALSHATAALLMRIGAMEQIDGGVFRPIKRETEYRMKNAQREWERDRNRFYSRVRTRMSAEPSPEFEKFATNLDKLLQDLCIEFGQTLAESMYRGSGKKLAWEQVKQYVDIHFSKSADIKAVRTLLDYVFANPSDAEYPYLYRLLSAAFLANSVRLDPTVSTSVKSRLSSYELFLDSNILIPAIVDECMEHRTASELLKMSRECGVTLLALDDMFQEVVSHRQSAERQVEELGGDIRLLRQAVDAQGGRANCYIQGYVATLRREEIAEVEIGKRTSWQRFVSRYNDAQLVNKLKRLGILLIECTGSGQCAQEYNEVLGAIEQEWNKRPFASNRHPQLNRHEAHQFCHVYVRRLQVAQSTAFAEVWFLSHETVLSEVFQRNPTKWGLPPTFPVSAWAAFLDARVGVGHSNHRSIVTAILRGASSAFELPEAADLVRRRAFGDRVPTEAEEAAIQWSLSDFNLVKRVENSLAAIRSRGDLAEAGLEAADIMREAVGEVDAGLQNHINKLQVWLEEEQKKTIELETQLREKEARLETLQQQGSRREDKSQGPPFRRHKRRRK